MGLYISAVVGKYLVSVVIPRPNTAVRILVISVILGVSISIPRRQGSMMKRLQLSDTPSKTLHASKSYSAS